MHRLSLESEAGETTYNTVELCALLAVEHQNWPARLVELIGKVVFLLKSGAGLSKVVDILREPARRMVAD